MIASLLFRGFPALQNPGFASERVPFRARPPAAEQLPRVFVPARPDAFLPPTDRRRPVASESGLPCAGRKAAGLYHPARGVSPIPHFQARLPRHGGETRTYR